MWDTVVSYHEQHLGEAWASDTFSGCEVIKTMATTTSEACKTSELLLQQSNTASNTCAILNSNTDFNCTNCDIKFDSESSLRVHLQVRIFWLKFANYLFCSSAPPPPKLPHNARFAPLLQRCCRDLGSLDAILTVLDYSSRTEYSLSTTKWSMLVPHWTRTWNLLIRQFGESPFVSVLLSTLDPYSLDYKIKMTFLEFLPCVTLANFLQTWSYRNE